MRAARKTGRRSAGAMICRRSDQVLKVRIAFVPRASIMRCRYGTRTNLTQRRLDPRPCVTRPRDPCSWWAKTITRKDRRSSSPPIITCAEVTAAAAAAVIALTRDKMAHRLPLFCILSRGSDAPGYPPETPRRFAKIPGEPDDNTHLHRNCGPLAFGFSSKCRAHSCVPPKVGRTPFQIDWWPPPATGTTRDGGHTR